MTKMRFGLSVLSKFYHQRSSLIFTFYIILQVIGRANNVKYGLCASVWSENVGRIHRVAQQLEVIYSIPHHTTLEVHYTTQRNASKYATVHHNTIQYNTIQHNTTQYNTAQHSTAQHSTAQHSTAQHSTAQHSTAQHSTAQHSTAQHSTAQHSTAQHSTAQHSTAQHSTAHPYYTTGMSHNTTTPHILMNYIKRPTRHALQL